MATGTSHSNFVRDTKRAVTRRVRELREQEQSALEEYAAALIGVQMAAHALTLARQRCEQAKQAARKAGNPAALIRATERMVNDQLSNAPDSSPSDDSHTGDSDALAVAEEGRHGDGEDGR
ncbi:MAG: hypothetical protein LKI21_07665 [Bifidobacterium crudilactis]|jgi:hypothetical protein|nr:hypothetical protein [Bifidobacterium crudilactis]